MDMILKNTFQRISPAYELIGDVTVGSNTTQVDFTGLNIGKGDEIVLVASTTNPTAFYNNISVYVNNNTTPTNYYRQILRAESTNVSGARDNSMVLTGNNPVWDSIAIINIKLTNSGYIVFQSHFSRDIGVANEIELFEVYGTSTFTATSITAIKLQGGASNAIGTGSRFQLYKLVAEKVADIIVPSNTTSVDITGLEIDKDGEYYLVSDVVGNSDVTGFSALLFANGNETATNYYIQEIYASNTSVTAVRQNRPFLQYKTFTNKGLSFTNIKLTNSGYITYQSSTIDVYGGSAICLSKDYVTSTFAVSSIMSLKIQALTALSIGANSRFTLYKLK